ncbi:MAG TPA: metallophosphoesterase [Bacillota bacterium]|nr:metallophosphoesterase [Bacillota bacterium]
MPDITDADEQPVVMVELEREVQLIGVVSDTHVPRRARCLTPGLLRGLEGVDLILHAGDLVDESVLFELQALAPVEAVAGNMDPPRLHERLKRRKLLHAGGLTIGLIHGDGLRRSTRQRAEEAFREFRPQVIVFGHSHQPLCEYSGNTLMFNPGSCVDPRWSGRPSYGILQVKRGGAVRGELLYL